MTKIKKDNQAINIRIPKGVYNDMLKILAVSEESLSNFCRYAIQGEVRTQLDYYKKHGKIQRTIVGNETAEQPTTKEATQEAKKAKLIARVMTAKSGSHDGKMNYTIVYPDGTSEYLTADELSSVDALLEVVSIINNKSIGR